jgi:HEAT repeat protein
MQSAAQPPAGAEKLDLASFLSRIDSPDAEVRYSAWHTAGPMGAQAVAPLAQRLASPDKGIAKAAKGALENVVHYAARPGAGAESHAVARELTATAADGSLPASSRAEALHLLGFVADGRDVPHIAPLLHDETLRDEARMALERIPGSASADALKTALRDAPPDFHGPLAQSLYCRKLTPQNAGILPEEKT